MRGNGVKREQLSGAAATLVALGPMDAPPPTSSPVSDSRIFVSMALPDSTVQKSM